MGKRSAKKAMENFRVEPGELVDTYETAAAAVAAARPSDVPASIEDRLASLERQLDEQDRIIRQQSLALAIGIEHAERLRKSRQRVKQAEDEAEAAKKAASEARKAYESAVTEHFELERDLDSPQQRLPFAAEPEEPEARPAARPEPAAVEAWRGVFLDTLDLSMDTVAKLHEANLTTVGDLCDYLKPAPTGFRRNLREIDGIGAAKAEEIEDALEASWKGQASPVSSPAPDANAEILAGVQQAEAGRAGDTLGRGPTTGVEFDSTDDDVFDGEYDEEEA